jgi:hypothetical protein
MLIECRGTFFEKYLSLAKQVLEKKDELVIYGGGNTGRQLIPVLAEMGIKTKAILDKNPLLKDKTYQGIPIYFPDEYTDIQSVIVVCIYPDYRDVLDNLHGRGFQRILPYFFYLFDCEVDPLINARCVRGYLYMRWCLTPKNPGVLYSIDVPVTEKCSLKCKNCSNLMQYFANPQHADFFKLSNALKKVLTIMDHCYEVRLLGGEPFVNLELYKYIEMLDEYSTRFDWIVIYTNATIIPNQRTLNSLKKRKILVEISDYGHPHQKCESFRMTLEQAEIPYFYMRVSQWQNCGSLQDYGRTYEQNTTIFRECCVKDTPSIIDGKLFRCPYAGSVYKLQAIPPCYNEFVDIVDPGTPDSKVRNNIQKLMSAGNLKVCTYCGGRPWNDFSIPAAIQIHSPLKYYIYPKE